MSDLTLRRRVAALVGIGASIAHADALLWEVGAGTGASTLVRIPLPSAGSPRM
jgi:hypothetical protein